ncbi:DUF4091 domain-containing protein [Gelidibacter maritimus]|uniref:DUF4091 domain-containing protein n=1 Tax=Gelidibacter maritimus TaxID=2761487 RepID=A0A7W2R3V7_9FLAO|nr:DUF4091 domain-containing protein [Gelidibacter maritimus]MBA6153251.1 DUF4091 domain-containing protein [Gelidibacter maritimus]
MKLIFKSLFVFLILLTYSCQNVNKDFTVAQTYEEPQDPSPNTDQDWEAVSNGLQASVTSTDMRFVKSDIPKLEKKTTWSGTAWKGERISAQIVLWSKDSLTKVTTEMSDFKSEDGKSLPSSIAKINFVKYVITDEFGEGCGHRKPEDFDASLAADALDPISSYALKSETTRPIWLTMNVPSDAQPGTYTSTFDVHVQGQDTQQFSFTLKVIDQTLPAATDWKFHLDLWQNPFAVARYHNVELWSEAHWDLLKPIMKRLADAGQKVITVSLNKRPWGGQTFDQFESMIEWRKKTDGTWTYDYSIFDQWVQRMMDLGIKNQISCYSMVPWGNEFYYFDEAENKEVKVTAAPGTKAYEDLWIPFLDQFKVHLEKKGWNNITLIAMDERGPEEMTAMLKLLNEHAPELGISFADNHKSYKLYPDDLKDMSVAFGDPVDEEDLKLRRENGYISTFYLACPHEFPNTYTFSPPAEGALIGWYAMAADFDGFLRWSYNSWVEHPLQDSRFITWPAGDTYIVYPENRSSIRFEKLREGIQDAEKIRILREDLTNRKMLDELDHLDQVVAQFNITSKPKNLEAMLNDAKNTLNILAEKLK